MQTRGIDNVSLDGFVAFDSRALSVSDRWLQILEICAMAVWVLPG